MLGNGVKETTTTTGTGTLTLSAVTGSPRVSDVFPVGSLVSYAINSGNDWEWAIGVVGAGNTLARSLVLATFVSGVYVNVSATTITLSGTSTVIVTPHAATTSMPTMPIDNISSGLLRGHVTTHMNGSSTTTIVADRMYYVPTKLESAYPIVSMSCYINTAAAGSKARMGLYRCGPDGYPTDLLEESSDIDSTTTGTKTYSLATPKFYPPGWYFTAFVCTGGANVRVFNVNSIPCTPFGHDANLSSIQMRYVARTAGWTSLPSTAHTSTTAANDQAFIQSPKILLGI